MMRLSEWWALNGYRIMSVAAFAIAMMLAMFGVLRAVGD